MWTKAKNAMKWILNKWRKFKMASIKTTLAEYTTRDTIGLPLVIESGSIPLTFEDGGRGDGNIIEGSVRIKASAFENPLTLLITFGSGFPPVEVDVTLAEMSVGWNEFTFVGESISKEGEITVQYKSGGSLTLDIENDTFPELILKRLQTGTTTIQGVQSITM